MFIKTPKQIEATKLHSKYVHVMLYGGARSGKTFIDVRNMVLRACKVKSTHLIGRHRFNAAKKAIVHQTLPKVMKICFPNLQYSIHKTDWYMELQNGSQIWFGGFDEKERVDKILGNEYSTIKLNECSEISWDTRNTLMSRLAENVGLKPLVMYDCNPISTKHWTYTVFQEGKSPDGETIKFFEDYASMLMNPSDNLANLGKKYLQVLEGLPARQRKRFLDGEFQDDIEGALWNSLTIQQAKSKPIRELKQTVVAIDPAVSTNKNSDLTGIIVASLDVNNEGVVHADYTIKASPNEWANRAINAYYKYNANYIIAEINQGGDLVKTLINNIDKNIKVVTVHASKGKFARAEPVAALYEQGKVRHEEGLEELETQLCEFVAFNAKESPDRLDALVYSITYLMLQRTVEFKII